MSVTESKIKELEASGFFYDFDREVFINIKEKICISKEAIDDHEDNWLDNELKIAANTDDWYFIFTIKPSPSVLDKLKKGFSKYE